MARGRDVVARWCALAEQRLEYLTELFETGRWRRFHSELAFLENIQEAKAAVETWRDLLTREATPDNYAMDISWVGRATTGLRRGEPLRDHAPRFSSDEAPSAPDSDGFDSRLDPALENAAAELTLDLAVMHERYPLLRNAL